VHARRGLRTILAVAAAVAVITAAGSPVASAALADGRTVIEVHPGPHALANALASASNGDVLNIHTGTYPEHVKVITPSVTLQAAGDGPVTIDARCAAQFAIAIRADGVTITGLGVQGATEGFGPFPAEVDFEFVASGTITHSTLSDSCDAEYGVNVYNSGPLTISRNRATGFSDAGIYIGGITNTGGGTLTVASNATYGNNRGIIVEDSFGVSMVIGRNDAHDNATSGIHLTNSDGIVVRGNTTANDGTYGIDLDASSDHNRVVKNTSQGNPFDLANLGGTGNCWKDNVYSTSTGTISC
jgi:parallel beta-helix repeat protein